MQAAAPSSAQAAPTPPSTALVDVPSPSEDSERSFAPPNALVFRLVKPNAQASLGILLGKAVGKPPIVKLVQPGSLGARSGVLAGDTLLSVNGKPVFDDVTASEMVRQLAGEVVLQVSRPATPKRGGRFGRLSRKGSKSASLPLASVPDGQLLDSGAGLGAVGEVQLSAKAAGLSDDAMSESSGATLTTMGGMLNSMGEEMGGIIAPTASLKEQAALMKEGHMANARGDTVRAMQLFRHCYDVGGRVEARISAANMSFKLGDFGSALAEYEAMQDFMRNNPGVLSPRVAKVIKRKHLEAAAAVQNAATAMNFLVSGPGESATKQFGGKGKLNVYVRRAVGLRITDMYTSDPYAILHLKGKTQTTRVIKATVQPLWDERFTWTGEMHLLARHSLDISVMDQDRFSRDDLLGKASIDLHKVFDEMLMGSKTLEKELAINLAYNGIADGTFGKIFIGIRWEPEPVEDIEWADESPTQPTVGVKDAPEEALQLPVRKFDFWKLLGFAAGKSNEDDRSMCLCFSERKEKKPPGSIPEPVYKDVNYPDLRRVNRPLPTADVPLNAKPQVLIKEFEYGTGLPALDGDCVEIQYVGRLLNRDGYKFASSDDGSSFTFVIGDAKYIAGLSQLVKGMRCGGSRRGVIPPTLGYDDDVEKAPAPLSTEGREQLLSLLKDPEQDATLVFDVKLQSIVKPSLDANATVANLDTAVSVRVG
ncbi:hypothetical protein AB1Y20_020589 [Prymnesium parvum]|uniref:peptidylprolyl isomerase n=1 Tax=Prymnesium parvum TaxID=97485 RepID=A0AB34JYI6_PRYPA